MQPLFAEFAKRFPNSVVFTGNWPGFIAGYESSFAVQLLKGVRFRADRSLLSGNPRGFSVVPIGALWKLWRARPELIFVRGFDLCTMYALVLKAVTGCNVVLFWGGTSPQVAYLHSAMATASSPPLGEIHRLCSEPHGGRRGVPARGHRHSRRQDIAIPISAGRARGTRKPGRRRGTLS